MPPYPSRRVTSKRPARICPGRSVLASVLMRPAMLGELLRTSPARWCRSMSRRTSRTTLSAPVLTQHGQQTRRQRHIAVFGAFALLDADQHALGIDVGRFKTEGFGDAKACAVANDEHGTGLQEADGGEELSHFGCAEHHGQLFRYAGAHEVSVAPRQFECCLIE